MIIMAGSMVAGIGAAAESYLLIFKAESLGLAWAFKSLKAHPQ